MGGNAFNTLLPNASFPRVPPIVYNTLKAQFTTLLQEHYVHVATPREAPEKIDYGDLDFVVCGPRNGISPGELGHALGASHIIPLEGIRGISNFAIPLKSVNFQDVAPFADGDTFFQVDVQACVDAPEWECYVSYNSYGDLGMILGTLARSLQLSLGHSGLKLANPLPTSPPVSFRLSSSFLQILAFFELSTERWTHGFATQREVFEWVASSPFFDPKKVALPDSIRAATNKARETRPMYQNFLEFVHGDFPALLTSGTHYPAHAALDMALEYFDRRALYTTLLHYAEVKKHAKAVFTGKTVEEWTSTKGMQVHLVMEEVRRKLGGTELLPVDVEMDSSIAPIHVTLTVWENAMFNMSPDALRQLIVDTKEEMDKDGKLAYDWREAKKRKAEQRTKQKALPLATP